MTTPVAQLIGRARLFSPGAVYTVPRIPRSVESRRSGTVTSPPRARPARLRHVPPHLRRGVRPETAGSPGPALGPRVQAEKRSSDQRPPSLLQAAVTAEVTAHSVEPARARWPGKIA